MNSSNKRNSVRLESAQVLHQQVQNCWFWNLRIWGGLKECEQLPKVHLEDYANSKNIRIYWRILKNLLEFCRNKQHLIGTIGIWNLPKFTNMFFFWCKVSQQVQNCIQCNLKLLFTLRDQWSFTDSQQFIQSVQNDSVHIFTKYSLKSNIVGWNLPPKFDVDGLGVDMLRGKMPSPGRVDNLKVAHIVVLFPFLETLVAGHL